MTTPTTYDEAAALVARLRDDLTTASAALTELRLREIADLEARLARLRAADASLPFEPEPTKARPAVAHEPCPYCGELKPAGRSLSQHTRRCPANPDRVDVDMSAARAARHATVEVLAPVWTCTACGCGEPEVARAASDPARCKACVRAANDAAETNRPKAAALS